MLEYYMMKKLLRIYLFDNLLECSVTVLELPHLDATDSMNGRILSP